MNLRELIEEAKESTKEMILEKIESTLKILKKEKKEDLLLIEPKNFLTIVGDLHGDFKSLVFILNHSNFFENEDKIIFLGDYGDRGEEQAEVYYFLLSLKEIFP
ncbi:MAG: metallophosphoesterase, partial [Candidatus Aenigmatarchaeota archaeon]